MPKMVVLVILSAWVAGSVITALISTGIRGFLLGHWAAFAAIAGIVSAAVLTDVRYTAFYGAIYRNNGAFSYLALSILFLGSMTYFHSSSMQTVRMTFFTIGALMTGYGILQIGGHDPFHWTVTYSPVMGTLGNPDFMSALLGVCAIATVWTIVMSPNMWVKVGAGAVFLLEIYVTKRTGSFQGLLIIAFGFAIIGVAKSYQRKKTLGHGALAMAVIGVAPIVIGFANKGPIASIVYRGSLQNRFDYWSAAINMFRSHPFVGVGLERFRDSYAQFAPEHQVVQGQMTDNAHNIFMQFLATGGLVVIVPYLFLLGAVLVTAVRGIYRSTGIAQLNLVGLFAIWFALLLDSFIAIDNLGVTVWFWVTGGILYGIANESLQKSVSIIEERVHQVKGRSVKLERSRVRGKSAPGKGGTDFKLLSPAISLVLVLVAFVAMVPAWNESRDLKNFKINSNTFDRTGYLKTLGDYGKQHANNVHMVTMLSDLALSLGYPPLALTLSKEVLKKDPRSYTGNYISAQASEAKGDLIGAIPYRVHLLTLDPWNTSNMLALVKAYVTASDIAHAKEIAAKISTLNPGGEDAKSANSLIIG